MPRRRRGVGYTTVMSEIASQHFPLQVSDSIFTTALQISTATKDTIIQTQNNTQNNRSLTNEETSTTSDDLDDEIPF